MQYDKDNLNKIREEYGRVDNIHDQLSLTLILFRDDLKHEKAHEYVMQGVGRRLKTLTRCIHNIFSIFPPDRIEQLDKDDLNDVNINLHAFFINISGIFDNLGWVFIYEKELFGNPKEGKVDRNGVGLFNKKTQAHLSNELKAYLKTEPICSWYKRYSKNYRDSLAHRIPLYVPPAVLNEDQSREYQELEVEIQKLDLTKPDHLTKHGDILNRQKQLGNASIFFAHSADEEGKPMLFHAQVIADYLTVEEVIKEFCKNF